MKYIVSMAIDGRADVEVDAESPEVAFRKANLFSCDLSKMEIVGCSPVNCSDAETGELIKDY